MNDERFKVKVAYAILTRPRSSPGLKPIADRDLAVIITYLENE